MSDELRRRVVVIGGGVIGGQAGNRPRGARDQWGHAFVQAEFIGQLIHRKKIYPAGLRDVLIRTLAMRRAADYGREFLTETQMSRILRRSSVFVETISATRGEAS